LLPLDVACLLQTAHLAKTASNLAGAHFPSPRHCLSCNISRLHVTESVYLLPRHREGPGVLVITLFSHFVSKLYAAGQHNYGLRKALVLSLIFLCNSFTVQHVDHHNPNDLHGPYSSHYPVSQFVRLLGQLLCRLYYAEGHSHWF
jgi:hypothetical protein